MQVRILFKMKHIKAMAGTFAAAALILLGTGGALGQSGSEASDQPQVRKDWITFQPPSKSFQIKLPEAPKHETRVPKQIPEIDSDVEFSMFKCSTSINYYRLPSQTGAGNYRMVIREIDISGCKRRQSDFDSEVSDFLKFISDGRPVVRNDKITVYGLRARHILYYSGSDYPGTQGSKIYNKILAVDAGKRILILLYFRGGGYDDETIWETFRPNYLPNDLVVPDLAKTTPPVPINTKGWILFTAPDASFTVELPELPKQEAKDAVGDRSNETDISLGFFRCTKFVQTFMLSSRLKPDSSRVAISVTDISGCRRKRSEFDKEISLLFSIIGGSHKEILSDKQMKVNGLSAREMIYKNGSEIYSRTIAIDGGTRIFVLTYDRLGGDLSEEERIFRTFNPSQLQ